VPWAVDRPLREFIDRAVVPALLERFLRDMKQAEAERSMPSASLVAVSAERV
jgi:hypothetical protein